ncbi:MAG: cytochrome C [candidate division Zixibacteria bacterium]|nr:cytochrome C [candidate division Zixibacteria bacterium]MBU1469882.1 cytochrome C [candidate division Zixibacteria bacterium]MBU2624012.1 cytochrome C [candidate division Zixibacteria bacterium]
MLRNGSLLAVALLLTFAVSHGSICTDCHTEITPKVVSDWQLSKHSENGIDCSVCHGEGHVTADDVANVQLPTAETCRDCHEDQVVQFSKGKHALAWAAQTAMPTTHMQPMALIEGMKGCGGCHKVGLKSEEEIKELKASGSGFGYASCDACHTRHMFSVKEAQQPQACQTCHMGFDHPQWEMYSASKHGVRYLLKQNGVLSETAAAPTCQTCHMQEGDHEVRTPWGFLAVRLPLPEDEQWKADQITILQALGVLDLEGNPTARLDVVKAADVARLTQEDFDRERDKLLKACSECHSDNFARQELEKGDDIIREADHLLAEAIRVIAGLYADGILTKPESYAYPFPDLLAFHDAPTPIEQSLFVMHLEHRMRAFQGAFHANPDYALWYGWSEMVRDLSDIKEMAKQMRASH